MWSGGYFVSTIGVDEITIKRYIENKGEEDIGQTALLFGTINPKNNLKD